MKRLILSLAALGLLLVATDKANASPWRNYGYGNNYGYYNYGYNPYGGVYSANYTQLGNDGLIRSGYASGYNNGFGYGYGQSFGYAYPATGYRYSVPAYQVQPVYYGNYSNFGYRRWGWR